MRRVLALFLVFLGLLADRNVAAATERRVALVIGNASYPGVPLQNPKNDANDVADTLTQLGFEVIRHIDVGRNDINDALEEFQRKVVNADAALFYYAGHAMQYNGQNYLLPIDAVLRDQYSVPQLTSLSRIKEALATCEECVKIMILDSCRDNPLTDRFFKEQSVKNRSLSSPARGLARLSEKPDGTIVVFATQAGDVAADGDGRNSPFTQAFLTELKKPELGLSELFNDVALDVKAATGKMQVPEISYSAVRTLDHFYINQNEGDNTAFERLDYSDIAALRHFIEVYPESSKRRFVENLIDVMERQARERADEARQAADRERLQAEDRQKAEATRLQQEAVAEERRKLEADRARLVAEADAKRQAEAKAEADRLQREADAAAQRKLDADRARLAAEANAKRQAEAKAEADRLQRETDAEAQRKLDADRARLAAEADAGRQAEAKAESNRLQREAAAALQRERDSEQARLEVDQDASQGADAVGRDTLTKGSPKDESAPVAPQPVGTQDAAKPSLPPEQPRIDSAKTCAAERAQFVVLRARGPAGLKALTSFKAHLVCVEMAPEVQAALGTMTPRAASQREAVPPRRTYAVAPKPSHSDSAAPVARVQPWPSLPSRPHLASEARQARSHDNSRFEEARPPVRLPPAPAVSASTPTVDFRGGSF